MRDPVELLQSRSCSRSKPGTSTPCPECRAEAHGSRLAERIRTGSRHTSPFRFRSGQRFSVTPNFRETVGFGETYDYGTFAVGTGEPTGKVALAISRHDFVAVFRGDRVLRRAGS